mgnify:CR=1 FL=1|tara:strand:- start:300 stop:416 length:117 start_codon:yes stop_codon:yes gene_type:complete
MKITMNKLKNFYKKLKIEDKVFWPSVIGILVGLLIATS